MVLLLVFMQLTRDMFAIAKFLLLHAAVWRRPVPYVRTCACMCVCDNYAAGSVLFIRVLMRSAACFFLLKLKMMRRKKKRRHRARRAPCHSPRTNGNTTGSVCFVLSLHELFRWKEEEMPAPPAALFVSYPILKMVALPANAMIIFIHHQIVEHVKRT